MRNNKDYGVSAIAAALVLTTTPVIAGQYKLVKGEAAEVCKVYKNSLNASKPAEPMLCERNVNPQFEELSKPEWKAVDIENKKRVLWNTFIFFHPTVAKYIEKPTTDQDVERAVGKVINLRSQALRKTWIDIDNDGKQEVILQYQDGICGAAQFAYSTSLVVLHDEGPDVNREKSDLLQQSTWRDPKSGKIKRDMAERTFNMYGVFVYRNTTYFDKASARSEQRNNLYVYSIAENQTQLVCEYRFVDAE